MLPIFKGSTYYVYLLISDTTLDSICKDRPQVLSVLDLGGGKGGDLLKWKKARIDQLVHAGRSQFQRP